MYREFYEGVLVEPALLGLVLFVTCFVAIVSWAYWPRRNEGQGRFAAASRLPLEDEVRRG